MAIEQKTLVYIFGQPCTGKSTLVDKIIASQDGIYCVDFDVVKRQLSGYYWKRDKDFARQLTQEFLDLVVKSEKPVIALLPMPSSEQEYDYYFAPARAAGYRIINVMLVLDRDEHIERYKVRLESIRQHNPNFKVKTLDEFMTVLDQEVYIPHDAMVLDSGKFDTDTLYVEFSKKLEQA